MCAYMFKEYPGSSSMGPMSSVGASGGDLVLMTPSLTVESMWGLAFIPEWGLPGSSGVPNALCLDVKVKYQ